MKKLFASVMVVVSLNCFATYTPKNNFFISKNKGPCDTCKNDSLKSFLKFIERSSARARIRLSVLTRLKILLEDSSSGNAQVSETAAEKFQQPNLPFIFSGYLDVNYFKNLNNPKNGSNTGLSGAARAFDQKENQFQLGMAQTKFSWSKKKTDAVIDLAFGPHADLANYGNRIGPFGVNVGSSALSIKQAYIVYRLNDKNSFTIGQFGTHIGYEVIEASLNYHYSLSNLFNNGPFYHQGLKYTHTFNKKLSAMAGIVNNWDNLYDNNRFKTAVGQIAFTPKPGYNFYVNYIGGNEDNVVDSLKNISFYGKESIVSFKQMIDLIAQVQVTKRITIAVNADLGVKSSRVLTGDSALKSHSVKTWGGIAAYISYTCSPAVSFGLRAEFFDNTSGVQYIGKTDVQSYTGTFNIKLDENLLFRPECRMDLYKKNPDRINQPPMQQFMDSNGNYTKNYQITIGAAVIYKF